MPLILYFECEILNGKPEIMEEEATEMKWVTIEEMKKLEEKGLSGAIIGRALYEGTLNDVANLAGTSSGIPSE